MSLFDGVTFAECAVSTIIVTPHCACGGTMVYGQVARVTSKAEYPHFCDKCKKMVILDAAYPKVVYKPKEKQ